MHPPAVVLVELARQPLQLERFKIQCGIARLEPVQILSAPAQSPAPAILAYVRNSGLPPPRVADGSI